MSNESKLERYKEKIIEKYTSGQTVDELIKNMPISRNMVYKYLHYWGVEVRPAIPRHSTVIERDEQEEIKKRYLSGESLRSVMLDYPYSWETGERFLRHEDIPIRGRYKYDHQCFHNLNEYSEYFAGLIVADGCLTYQHGRPDIHLASCDIDIIEKFIDFIGTPNKSIYRSKHDVFTVSVRSIQMAEDLLNLGIVPRKSFVEFNISAKLTPSRHFWRGMIDGDGFIGWANKKYPKMYLSSSCKPVIKDFILFLKNNKLYASNNLLSYRGGTFHLYQQTSGPVLKILNLLYVDSNVSINRKHKKAMELINEKRRY